LEIQYEKNWHCYVQAALAAGLSIIFLPLIADFVNTGVNLFIQNLIYARCYGKIVRGYVSCWRFVDPGIAKASISFSPVDFKQKEKSRRGVLKILLLFFSYNSIFSQC
jgi:hypothetical protein